MSYPALYDPENKNLHALFGSASFVIGRGETADLTVLDLSCSRQQFRIVRNEAQHFVEQLSRTSPTPSGSPRNGPTSAWRARRRWILSPHVPESDGLEDDLEFLVVLLFHFLQLAGEVLVRRQDLP
jgi:hypothetical protein